MENTESRLYFASDYMEGAHPAIMKKLMETNLEKTVGYGQDPYTEDAKEKIREACNAPEAEVFLLIGGTQTFSIDIGLLFDKLQKSFLCNVLFSGRSSSPSADSNLQ